MLLVLLAVCISFVRNHAYIEHTNHAQQQVIAQAEALLGPDDAYCDGIGMIPTRHLAGRTWWDRPRAVDILHRATQGDFSISLIRAARE
jgi:hypothetical protein